MCVVFSIIWSDQMCWSNNKSIHSHVLKKQVCWSCTDDFNCVAALYVVQQSIVGISTTVYCKQTDVGLNKFVPFLFLLTSGLSITWTTQGLNPQPQTCWPDLYQPELLDLTEALCFCHISLFWTSTLKKSDAQLFLKGGNLSEFLPEFSPGVSLQLFK